MTFRNITNLASTAIAIAAFSSFAASDVRAQASATDSANIAALISNPITLSKTGDLDFGEISPSTGSTTVVVTTASATTGSTASLVGGTPAAASFDVGGLALRSYSITLPGDGTITIDDAGAGVAMDVDGFNHDAGGTPALGAGGTDSFNVGATLTVGADQLAGTYTGSFDVTVDYN